jgi:hypothetical protein
MGHVLVFSPYAARRFHILYEGTIAKACIQRGARVDYLLCDGLLPECDMHWDALMRAPRSFSLCDNCQLRAQENMAELDLPYRYLGEFISPEEKAAVLEWSQNLPIEELETASFAGYPISEWIMSSVSSYFRQYPPDFSSWRTLSAFRGFLYSGAIVLIGLRNLLDTQSVDAAVIFNGRISITRVAFEVFRMRGIRVLTHEAPTFLVEHLDAKANATCIGLSPFADVWKMWGQIPLTQQQLEKSLQWLIDRRYARNKAMGFLGKPFLHDDMLRQKLNLHPDKRLLALFTTSMDEIAAESEWKGPYNEQHVWVEEVVNWVQARDDLQLVIRVHPNLANSRGAGRADAEIKTYEAMRTRLPENVRLVMPEDPLSTYALVDEADIGLTFCSTVGIEMAMLGKPIVLAGRNFYENGSLFLTIHRQEELPDILEASLQAYPKREIQREAFRLLYYYVFSMEMPFPLVNFTDQKRPEPGSDRANMLAEVDRADRSIRATLNYASPETLAPGQDANLDRICSFLLQGENLYATPSESERQRTTAAEDAFFDALDRKAQPMRNKQYERWLKRVGWLNQLSETSQTRLQRMPFGMGRLLIRVAQSIYRPILHWVEKKV